MNDKLLPIHIAAGGLALVLGAVALLAKKGGSLHRRSGMLFGAMFYWLWRVRRYPSVIARGARE